MTTKSVQVSNSTNTGLIRLHKTIHTPGSHSTGSTSDHSFTSQLEHEIPSDWKQTRTMSRRPTAGKIPSKCCDQIHRVPSFSGTCQFGCISTKSTRLLGLDGKKKKTKGLSSGLCQRKTSVSSWPGALLFSQVRGGDVVERRMRREDAPRGQVHT